MKVHPKLVLASSSPFRKELLRKICPQFDAASPDIDESCHQGESPIELSARLAVEKAQALVGDFPDHLIIGSDQVAMLGEIQLTKPGTFEKSIQQLTLSSGKTITFYTSVCVLNSKTRAYESDMDICTVHMRQLSTAEIKYYVGQDKPYGCAAAFKSEGLGIALFEKIEGSDPNALVGLPLIKLARILKTMGHNVL
ncbi:MAG: septum formation inhibitor Maf [Cycloclasticus sp. symbiont of Bathymodiolus heckerae]|nr:MAG: septum formation inhibitor Maf [Cycloclasticus sp. symbiont of Bathymodiolus heckerae]